MKETFDIICSKFMLGEYTKKDINVLEFSRAKYTFLWGDDIEHFEVHPIENEEELEDQIGKTLLYLWSVYHNDDRYKKMFDYVLIPNDLNIDMSDILFEELLYFISHQTKITNKN